MNGFIVNDKAFTILANDGADAIMGRFKNLAEGAPLSVGGRPYAITYFGGDGNDVVLREGIAPTVDSIERYNPATARTNADQVTFRVTFSEDVMRVGAADFAVSGTASPGAVVNAVAAVSGSVYDVTITGIENSNGKLVLGFAGGQDVADLAGNLLTNTTPDSSQSYTIDNTAPTFVGALRHVPLDASTSEDQVTFRLTFSEDTLNVDAPDFTFAGTAAAGATVASVTPVTGTSVFDVTVSGIADSNGPLGIALSGSQNVTNVAGNLVSNRTATTNETYQMLNAALLVVESGGGTAVSESGTTDTFTVVLSSAPTSSVVIDVSSADAGEVTVDTPLLIFNAGNWNVPKTVTVRGVDDPEIDGDLLTAVTVAVDMASSDPAYALTPNATVSVTTADNDVAGFTVTQSGGVTAVSETGTTDSFTVVLNAKPQSNVVFNLSFSDATEGSLDRATLTFTPADWNVPQTVTVTGVGRRGGRRHAGLDDHAGGRRRGFGQRLRSAGRSGGERDDRRQRRGRLYARPIRRHDHGQ